MPERIPALQTALAQAQTAIEKLSKKVDLDEHTLRRTKRTARLALFSVVLDLTLTALVGWGLVGVNDNQDRITTLQSTVQIETERTKTALCAVITLFLQFEPRTISNPTYTEEQRAQQVQAYQVLRQIDRDLGCS
ncbi:hypothetical protein ACIA5H_37575 [Nocardia sp. NPDC051900]|uniref:hypothetical protein n=1 Tax=Nocardia sp. NPDC051900 TaxID=3364326 RepID=UPI0037943738